MEHVSARELLTDLLENQTNLIIHNIVNNLLFFHHGHLMTV